MAFQNGHHKFAADVPTLRNYIRFDISCESSAGRNHLLANDSHEYQALFTAKIKKIISQNLSSAVVVFGALRFSDIPYTLCKCIYWLIYIIKMK